MKATALSTAVLIGLLAATSAFAGNGDGYAERGEDAPRGKIVVSDRVPAMSVFDYFFNNPEKYRTMRNGPGEYYQGATRR